MGDRDRMAAWSPVGGRFVFDERVVRVFNDMIRRSVPGYEQVVLLSGLLAARYAQDDSRVYDLGCSLGATTLSMHCAITRPGVRLVAVDASRAMVEDCRRRLEEAGALGRVELVESDVRDIAIEDASVVAMNFTLQFLEPADRDALLGRIHRGLRPGGVLLLAEKTAFGDPAAQALHSAWHEDFKRANGYSELEIARKRNALERVLLAETEEAHRERLARAGFGRVERWFQCFGFAAFLAQK